MATAGFKFREGPLPKVPAEASLMQEVLGPVLGYLSILALELDPCLSAALLIENGN